MTNGTLLSERKYLYDGLGLIAELDSSDNATMTYAWGLDMSGTLQGAGGVGGLLLVTDHATGKDHYVDIDGQGDERRLVDSSDGSLSAEYGYGPFDEPLRATGNFANKNCFRFSTKFDDPETRLLYYGMRYYNTTTGSWISRDPLGEQGGLNLYGFVGNDPINDNDCLGLFTLQNARNSLCSTRCSGKTRRAKSRCLDQCRRSLGEQEIFDEWYRLEKTQGEWWTELPRCPYNLCISNGLAINPDSSEWENPTNASRFERALHPGAVWSLRSKPVNGHANQCTYTEDGYLITGLPGAGTVDWIQGGAIASLNGHFIHDVAPVIMAGKLDGNEINFGPDGLGFRGELSKAGINVMRYYEIRPSWNE